MPTQIELERENIELRERNIILNIENKQLKERIILLKNPEDLPSEHSLFPFFEIGDDRNWVEKVDLEKLLKISIVVGVSLGSFIGISIGLTW